MRILESKLENGIISARLLVEYDDIVMAAGQQQAISQAIIELSESLDVKDVHYASVLGIEENDMGDLEVIVEAAVSPEVTLGQYRGLEVPIGHNEDFEQAAVRAAAKNIVVDIPELIIDRQLDSMEREASSQLLQSTSLHTLADIFSIISRLNRQLDKPFTEEELWKNAMKSTELYVEKNAQDVDLMVEAIKEVCPLPEETIFRGIVTRAQERAKVAAEEIAAEIFAAYLHSQNQSPDQWRREQRDAAIERCRIELMLKAVIKAEGIRTNDVEVQRFAYELACGYGMDVQEFLDAVGEEGIRAQLDQQEAVKLIVDSAKGI